MRIATMFLVMLLMSVQVMAKGTIAGIISDEKTGEPIIGATIVVQGTAIGTATDVDGRFQLMTDAGTYVVEIKYLGYQSKNISDVVVTDGKVTEVNALLNEDSKTALEEVVVTASLKKESINALYVMQKNSVSVSSGISADIIQRTPDRNTGEVLKRVSGASIRDNKYVIIRGLSDRYNLAMINNALMPSTEPDKKAFSFDVIPSNLIDNIIINKTATPDMPGDFAGGIVQVLTKDVPERNFLNIGLSLGYNSQVTFNEVTSNGRSTGEYFGFQNKSNELPSSFGNSYQEYNSFSQEKKNEAARQLSNNYKEVKTTALPNSQLQLSGGNVMRMKNGDKLGTVIGLSYRNGYNETPEFIRGKYETARVSSFNEDNTYKFSSNLAALANFSYVTGKSKISLKNLYNRIFDNTYYQRDGYTTSNDQQIRSYSSIPSERQILNTQLEGEHAFGKNNAKANWNLNYSSLKAGQNDLRTAFYSRNTSFDGNDEPIENESESYNIVDRNSRRYFGNQTDNNYGANFSVSYPFQMLGQKQTLKAGYLGLFKFREFGARIFQYEPQNVMPDHEISGASVDNIFDPSNIKDGGFRLQEITNPTDRYEASGLLNSGFAMLDNNFGDKWRLTWGVRFESYAQNIQAVDQSGTKIDKTDIFNDVLPSFNLSYSFNESSKLRLSGSRTVNRPEFREIAPFQFIDFENLWTISGNPDLKRGNINNFDLRYDLYPSAGEAITVGVFYKQFENPIEAQMDDQSNLDLFIFTYKNATSAKTMGAEIDVRKTLSFLGPQQWLQNFTLGANFTYVHSAVDVSNITGGAADRPLQGQSPYLINASALYNDAKTGLAVSAMYNRIGHRIYIVGSSSIPTTWENGRDIVDLQISKQVFKNRGEVKFTIGDLLNQPTTFFWNTDGKDSYSAGDSKVGVGNDQIFQQYRWGTTYTVGFNYRLFK